MPGETDLMGAEGGNGGQTMRDIDVTNADSDAGLENFGAYSLTTAEIVFAEPSTPDRAAAGARAASTWAEADWEAWPQPRAALRRLAWPYPPPTPCRK